MIDGDGEIFEDPTKLRALVKELNASPEALTFKIQQNGQWIDSQFKPSKVLAEVVADSARTSCSSSDIVFQFNPNYPRLKEKYIVKNTQLGVFFGDQQLYSLQKHPDPKSHYPLIAPLASNDLALQFISDWKVNTKDVYPMEILKAEASEVNRKPALENT